MSDQPSQWQVQPNIDLPSWFIQVVRDVTPDLPGDYAAKLLWQRGIRDPEQLGGFLNPNLYKPASPFEFGQEMHLAVGRLQQAQNLGEIVAIWGDFDADGITSTAVLWDGLGQFFSQNHRLFYYIPNRLTESHGLNNQGIDKLHNLGVKLIVTCDTGSTNISEIEYAGELGIDVIVTDHHTLPDDRPPVTAIINPRYFPTNHQLYHLSGVAVAYKLVEALYETLPDVPEQPLEDLLDLVAIGLIADLVKLSGDCRYLAQRGIERLQQQTKKPTRPGIARLLELCQKNGDRPTDISFGLGPRINAVSRIQGDASFCVELLTSRDQKRCQQLAYDTELANSRRKSLQKDVTEQVKKKLSQLDLSTTSVIVLCDEQWAVGVLGLVAGQIAQEYGRPTILLSTEGNSEIDIEDNSQSKIQNPKSKIARGSARSVNEIDLYKLILSQVHLLHRFGGHPFAAGLSLPEENIPLFTEAINQQLRQLTIGTGGLIVPTVQADIICTVRELGKDLFRELKLLEPCGMGNPVPKLLIKNCWFQNVSNYRTQDLKGKKIQYIKTEFKLCDDSIDMGFPGIWWGHYKEELPQGDSDVIVELDYNNYKKRYEVRLIAVRASISDTQFSVSNQIDLILDWRGIDAIQIPEKSQELPIVIKECPSNWDDLQVWFRRAIQASKKVAIAYPSPSHLPPKQIWEQLIGIAKYLSRTGKTAGVEQIADKLGISERTVYLGMEALSSIGFQVKHQDLEYKISWEKSNLENERSPLATSTIKQFLSAIREEQFYQHYFSTVPLSTMQAVALQTKQ